jgi:predicted metal-dependent phosphotriesterase family hydrolase
MAKWQANSLRQNQHRTEPARVESRNRYHFGMRELSSSLKSRRAFLGQVARVTAACAAAVPLSAAEVSPEGKIMSVLGPIPPDRLGKALSHEHCVVDFLGAEKSAGLRHDRNEALQTILPHLRRLKELGGNSFFECTPNYIGRDVQLLRQLATASGLNIVTNTGYYGAAGNKFIPRHALVENEDDLAARWMKEWRDGIDGSGVRPGFIKLGVEKGKLPDLHVKLVRAGARLHLQSGLTIAIHTGDGVAALDELRVLREEGVAAGALIWVHAQNDPTRHVEVARRGGWVSLDGYSASEKNRERYKLFLLTLRKDNLLDRALVSHDHFWSVEGTGERGSLKLANGAPNPFAPVFTHLVPDLQKSGFTDAEIHLLLVTNPAKAFTIQKRT